ncbi:MAG: Zn-dependent exopeptidase M28 [Roseicyclus sp.]|nr:Zn-dependent exopeptidase M28 [Roseicyclus sp.]
MVPAPTRRALLLGAGLLGAGATFLRPTFAHAQATSIADLVDQVRPQTLRQHVFGLSAFPTRWTDHPDFPAVEQWVVDAFGADGAEITRQPYAMPSGKTRHNIVVGDPSDPREMVLVGAHFDSISQTPAQDAPGANDNATGIAALLEAQRILAPLNLDRQIVFVAFSGEEQGLLGSRATAEIAAQEAWPLALMLNLDMLGFRPPQPDAPMVIEFDQGNVVPSNDAQARAFGHEAARLAAAHTTLNTTHTDIWASDYMPFEARGFPCIGFYDGGAESAFYHTSSDSPDHVDYQRLEQVTRLVVATLASAGGLT